MHRLVLAIASLAPLLAAGKAAPVATPLATTAAPAAFLGKWSGGQSAYSPDLSVSFGSRVRQYDFRPNGTYTHHSESWGGTFNSNWRYIVNESGTWTANGDQLSVTPAKISGEVRDLQGKVQQTKSAPPLLEKTVTYRFQTTYFSGIQETQLVLTLDKPTTRDGTFAQNDAFPNSYLLSNNNRTTFKFPLAAEGPAGSK